MENYICTNCKFVFKTAKTPLKCPYCNKNSVEKEKSASDLIEEIFSLLE